MTKFDWIYSQYRKACKKQSPSLVGLWAKVNYDFPFNNEVFEIIGERQTEIEIRGDFSAGTNCVCQSSWINKSMIKQLGYLQPKARR